MSNFSNVSPYLATSSNVVPVMSNNPCSGNTCPCLTYSSNMWSPRPIDALHNQFRPMFTTLNDLQNELNTARTNLDKLYTTFLNYRYSSNA